MAEKRPEKRFLVFVSSTFEDLKEEREKVLQAILERRGFPDGMELFPAASEQQWQFIKHEIEICDYYIIVVGGRYGSVSVDGVSYTEMEFDYALKLRKPILAFLHKNPGQIPADRSEQDPKKLKKLNAFRKKIKTDRVVKFYETPDQLKTHVVNALSDAFASQGTPQSAQGWVRAGSATNVEGGLSEFREAFRDLSHEKMLMNSETVYIVLNDGRGWIDSNRDLLEARSTVPNQKTYILVLHPRSDFLPILVKKNHKLLEAQIDEILRTYRVVEGLRSKHGDSFEIRGHDLFNPFSLFLGDDEAYVMPYFLNEAGQLPVCIFQKTGKDGSLYERYSTDVKTRFRHARVLSEIDFPPRPKSTSA